MRILTAADLKAALDPQAAFDAVRGAFAGLDDGTIESPPRQLLGGADGLAMLGVMPALETGPQPLWALKLVFFGAANRELGLASHQGVVVLADGRTGQPHACLEAGALTAIRTAATSAVATDALARPDIRTIAVLGGGAQAEAHVHALRARHPEGRIVLWARSGGEELAARLGVAHASTVRDAAYGADVICTTSAATEPILSAADVSPGTHINAVGATGLRRREIAGDLIARARLFTEIRAQVDSEGGEVLQARAEGRIDADTPVVELADVVAGRAQGREAPEDVTLFKSLGVAAADLAVARAALVRAERTSLGTEVAWSG